MAGSGLLALLDDIIKLTEIAARKTSAVVGDDLALNAKQVIGIDPSRELPVIGKVALGSLKNKVILIAGGMGISQVAPWLISPLLMVGGAYLCYEGVEKILHDLHHKNAEDEDLLIAALTAEDHAQIEKDKINSAIRTDFVLSAEIMAITLGSVEHMNALTQLGTMAAIGVGMTGIVYGLVAAIVKADDVGLHMTTKTGNKPQDHAIRQTGEMILKAVPPFMKILSVGGTIAMFTVGGGILAHGIPPLSHMMHDFQHAAGSFAPVVSAASSIAIGLIGGAATIGAVNGSKMAYNAIKKPFQPKPTI